MLKCIARRPKSKIKKYLKYGFVITEHEFYYCPRCEHTLNAGPDYQPNYCNQCGQHLNFSGIKWSEDRELGYISSAKDTRWQGYEQI